MQQTYPDRLLLKTFEQHWRVPAVNFKHGCSACQFNAIRLALEGKISGTVERLILRKKALKSNLQAIARAVTRAIARLFKNIAGQIKPHAGAKALGIVFFVQTARSALQAAL